MPPFKCPIRATLPNHVALQIFNPSFTFPSSSRGDLDLPWSLAAIVFTAQGRQDQKFADDVHRRYQTTSAAAPQEHILIKRKRSNQPGTPPDCCTWPTFSPCHHDLLPSHQAALIFNVSEPLRFTATHPLRTHLPIHAGLRFARPSTLLVPVHKHQASLMRS